MKLFSLFLATLITGCASGSSTGDAQNVQVLLELKQECKFVRWQDCTSYRENGDKRCYKRLKKMAVKAGADTVLVDELIDHSEMIQLDNNAFSDQKTVVEARLYLCNETPEM